MALAYTPNLVSTPREDDHIQCPVNVTWTVQSVDHFKRLSPTPQGRSFTWQGYSAPTSSSVTLTSPSPAAGATVGTIPTFSWKPVSGADHYEVWWFSNPSGSDYVTLPDYNASGANPLTESFTPVQSLPIETGAWEVVAVNAANGVIAASEKRMLTVAAPDAISPIKYSTNNADGTTTTYSNGATINATPLVTWTQNPNMSYYRVYISQDVNFTNIVRIYDTEEVDIRSIESLLDNQAGQSYYIAIQPRLDDWYTGVNSTGTIAAGGTIFGQYGAILDPAHVWSFHKQSSPITPLKVAGPLSSAPTGSKNACDDGSNQATFSDMPTFCWNTNSTTPYASADVGPMQYHIQVSTTADFTNIIDQAYVDQASYTPYKASYNAYKPGSTATSVKDLTYPDGPIYWRVQAVDGSNTPLTYSATGSYTKNSSASNPVVVTGPGNGATVGMTPSLTWKSKTFAAQYNVQVFKNGDTSFSDANKVFDQKTDLTAITPSANNSLTNGTSLPAGDYTWRVRAIDAAGNSGAWTYAVPAQNTPYGFTVQPAAPSLTQPTNNSSYTSYSGLTFDWTPVTGAVSYRIYISTTNPPTSSPKVNATTVSSAWALTTALANATYYWEVLALDAQGSTLSTSVVNKFTYNGSRPSATTLKVTNLESAAYLAWDTTPVSAVGQVTSFNVVATDKTNASNSRSVTVSPGASVSPPNTGGSNGTTVCTTPTTTSVAMHCGYLLKNLVNADAYSVVITPVDGNGPGTAGTVNAAPKAYLPFSNLSSCATWMYQEFLSTTPSPKPNPTTGTCSQQANSYWHNAQFQSMFAVARLYHAYLLRTPDFAGLKFWMKRRATPKTPWTLNSISSYFAGSSEFVNKYGSLDNSDFVNQVYLNVLGRPADAAGLNYYVSRLNNRTYTRGRVMTAFSEGSEYARKVMPAIKPEMVTLMILKRPPTAAELTFYQGLMGGSTNIDPNNGAQTALTAAMQTLEFANLSKANPNS